MTNAHLARPAWPAWGREAKIAATKARADVRRAAEGDGCVALECSGGEVGDSDLDG